MHTSSRLGLDIIDAADAVEAYPTVNQQAMGILDTAVTINAGTLSARPSGSYVGQTYYATDTGLLYVYVGSAWETVSTVGTKSSSASGSLNISSGTQVDGVSVSVLVPASGLVRVSAYAQLVKDSDGTSGGMSGSIYTEILVNGAQADSPFGSNSDEIGENCSVSMFNGFAAPAAGVVITGTGYAGSVGSTGYVNGLMCAGISGNGDPTLESVQMRGAPIDLWLSSGEQTIQLAFTTGPNVTGTVVYQSLTVEPVPFS